MHWGAASRLLLWKLTVKANSQQLLSPGSFRKRARFGGAFDKASSNVLMCTCSLLRPCKHAVTRVHHYVPNRTQYPPQLSQLTGRCLEGMLNLEMSPTMHWIVCYAYHTSWMCWLQPWQQAQTGDVSHKATNRVLCSSQFPEYADCRVGHNHNYTRGGRRRTEKGVFLKCSQSMRPLAGSF
jgi:hypothetical protein